MSAVYFAKVGDYVKIGFSDIPHVRIKSLLNGSRLIVPDDLDRSQPIETLLMIPFCRRRDEANMHLLFGQHWSGTGEWFHWSPAFEHQMRTMRFVTHAERLKDLRRVRKELGIVGEAVKEAHFGKTTTERLARESLGGAA